MLLLFNNSSPKPKMCLWDNSQGLPDQKVKAWDNSHGFPDQKTESWEFSHSSVIQEIKSSLFNLFAWKSRAESQGQAQSM